MSLYFKQLESYCDSLDRVGNIQVILRAHYKNGFALSVSDGVVDHTITDEENQPYFFRTVEMALDELANIPYLSEQIMIDRKFWS
ncbi:hypothetical protein [Pseudomonas sp. FP818]|uniref:hypothetical protein n=1 Tax=Pseudomonas sp. FP818 TaxID=2954099 RepID=UPI002735E0F6|nr:hypothetical protein [Pseudomonas sp. FP818]WLI34272.1 hypothetical protein PSH80_24380 [Pseudomonas sp. FP818]